MEISLRRGVAAGFIRMLARLVAGALLGTALALISLLVPGALPGTA